MNNVHHHHTHYFPKGFLWGTATSAHQVEGSNYNNDWWQAEEQSKIKFKSGKACDHYHNFKEDFEFIEKMNNNAHRLSVEWSRIEPREGEWNLHELEHYRKVLKDLKKRKIKIMLTLHHFTNPIWFAKKGGFEKFGNVRYFLKYVRIVTQHLGEYVDYWITINEPGVYIYQSYEIGVWPPFKKSMYLALKVYLNLVKAHKRAYKIIHHEVKAKNEFALVGISQNVLSFATYRKHSLINNIAVWLSVTVSNHGFYILTGKQKTHDFLGLNYYFRIRLTRTIGTAKFEIDDISTQERETSDIGWEIYPHGMFDVLMDFRDYKLPIFITENGIATTNDDKRMRFIVAHLNEIYHAIKGGSNVMGYFHWSLLDNYEWHLGFAPRFGLVEVNFKTFTRKLKGSGKIYSEIAKTNGLEHKMFRLLGHEAKIGK